MSVTDWPAITADMDGPSPGARVTADGQAIQGVGALIGMGWGGTQVFAAVAIAPLVGGVSMPLIR